MSVYVGIDVRRKRSQVAVVGEDGRVQLNRNVVNGSPSMLGLLGGLPAGSPVAFEAAFGWGVGGRAAGGLWLRSAPGAPAAVQRPAVAADHGYDRPAGYWSGPGRAWLASLDLPAASRHVIGDDLAVMRAAHLVREPSGPSLGQRRGDRPLGRACVYQDNRGRVPAGTAPGAHDRRGDYTLATVHRPSSAPS
jgi:hypothetical protein